MSRDHHDPLHALAAFARELRNALFFALVVSLPAALGSLAEAATRLITRLR